MHYYGAHGGEEYVKSGNHEPLAPALGMVQVIDTEPQVYDEEPVGAHRRQGMLTHTG